MAVFPPGGFAGETAAELRRDPPPFVPRLRVRGAERPVRLLSLAMRTDIRGGIAETSLDMIFFNPNARVLEGELRFPLLPGQEVSGLALDVAGEMRRGVPVPKARGREVFEDVVRRGVDPALLEAARGNARRLRVYPIPARGVRRVMVRVMQPLTERDGMFTLRQPLAFAEHIDDFSVEVMVASDAPPTVESGSLGLVLERAGTLYRGKAEKTDISPEGWLAIGVPATEAPGKSLHAVRWREAVIFTATASVDMRIQKRELPKTVAIVWDASGSGSNRDHAREYALLDRYFAALGDGTARLVVVRNAAEDPKEFPVRRGDWSELKAYLHRLPYDGGTDLSSWKPTGDCPEYLLFTDGLANFGGGPEKRAPSPPPPDDAVIDVPRVSVKESALYPLLPGQRLYAVTSSVEADRNFLRHASGGRLVDLLRHDDDAAAEMLLADRTRVSLAPEELADRGEALLDPLSAFPEPGSNRLRCRLAGWIVARDGAPAETVTLRIEHPDGKREAISLAVPIDESVPRHTGGDAPLPARLWGRYAISELEADAGRNKAAIRRLGSELGIVSRETSLLVLETAADYIRYDVEPPASLAREVGRLRDEGVAPRAAAGHLPMERLEAMWKEKIGLWKGDWPQEEKRRPERSGTNENSYGLEGMERLALRGARKFLFGADDEAGERQDSRDAMRTTAKPSAPGRPSGEPGFNPGIGNGGNLAMVNRSGLRAGDTAALSGEGGASGSSERNVDQEPASSADSRDGAAGSMGIAMQSWDPGAPYIERMNKAAGEDMYAIYLDERPDHSRSGSFFLDMAGRFFAAGMPDLGLRALSNLAEIDLENRQLLRVLAYRLLEAGEAGLALGVLEKVRELAPDEPRSLRDLALAHKALGDPGRAADLLYEVARRKWDDRFRDINVIALTELNALIAMEGKSIDVSSFDSRLIGNLPSDLRVTLSWDADDADMDLWVTDPDGEKCYYANERTMQGGIMSRDCTQGCGPEEFMLKNAKPGTYRVEVDCFGSGRRALLGEVAFYVAVITGFGTPGQKEQVVAMRLKRPDENVLAGEFTVR